ncbi:MULTISPECIES: contractile injection system tape measure protein [Calothrix]|uniref:Uncharacterized protein n=2 Tax=Calothrix TaxID=1186 RepID=A0ABR8A4E4_9CYAN|nr:MULTISPECIES: contractile injection system tape measure protein [Calothrix]MBD2194826.1 hypothetical protein [Calothrix parietina FACHB-288]MBD2223424.1 hypothetical protein [Calothrix anomala FACHB-343]
MTKQRHIIGKTVLELDTGQIADVWSLQEDMSRLLQQQGVQEMERLFDQLLGDEQVIRLDRVVVEIGYIDRRFLADEFIRNLIKALRETLADHLADRLVGSAKTEKITRDRSGSDWEVLLYFLRYGRLPWWCPSGDWLTWFPRWAAVMQNDTSLQQSLRELLINNQAAKQRLIEQLPESFLHQLILQLQPAWVIWSTRLAQAQGLMQSGKLDSSAIRYLNRQAWLLLLSEISADNAPTKPFPANWTRNWLAQLLKIWQQSANFTDYQPQISQFNQISQQISADLQGFPSEEQRIWLTALEQVLTAISDPTARSPELPQTHLQTDWQVLLYFLEHGRLPNEAASTTWQTWLQRWETVIQTETAWQIPLRPLLNNNVAARQRLIIQLPPALRHQLILQLQPAWTNWYTLLAQAQQLMQSLSLNSDSLQKLNTQAWELLLAEISSDNPSLNPLPAANWTSNWLAQLVQNWRWGDKEAGEQGSRGAGGESDELAVDVNVKQIAWERLRSSIDAISRAERNLWLNAYNQVLNLTATEKKERSPQLPQTTPQTDWQVLLYFLEHGRLPDEQASTTWQTWLQRWETVIQTETTWQLPLRQLLINNVASRQRLITQFPPALRHQVILQLQPAWTNWYTLLAQAREIIQSLNLSNDNCEQLEQQAWLLLLAELSFDNPSLNPLPAANWTRNWLTKLLQIWRLTPNTNQLTATSPPVEAAAPTQNQDAVPPEIANQKPQQNLRQRIAAFPISDSTLWQNALEQMLTATLIDISTPPFETKTSALPPIPQESTGVPAPSSPETNIFTYATPTPQQNPSVEQVELPTPEPTNPLSIPPRRARGSRLSKSEETAGLYVNQAGIVLLHPFLTVYLDAVGLLDGESFRDELAQQTAIYLLHYLATKQTDAPEYELVLPKLLCGWPLDEPVSRGLDLPATALTEGENLLQTVINYWEALKSTSPDGLREGFLQRAGKLTQADGNWKLQVEQQAIDILLGRLPWGLSMVKLPMMDDILIVEWH